MMMISERSLLFKELAIFCFNREEKVDASLGHTGPESGEVEVPGRWSEKVREMRP